MNIGDAFLFRNPEIDDHLRIVISDPGLDAENIVTVSLTSYNQFSHKATKDGSCVLERGDHPWILHTTCVSYRDGKVSSEEFLDGLINKNVLVPQKPVTDDVLTRILEGAEQTDELPNKCRLVLAEQRLIQI